MKTTEQKAKRIFGQRASRYTTSAAHTDPQVLARVVELASPQRDWLVLDVATGTGHTAFALAGHVRAVIGIDLTVKMLEESKRPGRDPRKKGTPRRCRTLPRNWTSPRSRPSICWPPWRPSLR